MDLQLTGFARSQRDTSGSLGLKRRDLIRHLEAHGCELLREGGNHSIYVNTAVRKTSSVPRHNEINNGPREEFAETFKCRAQLLNGMTSCARPTRLTRPT
jgi:predicted RNA binding protein YcfA (HicA-like mRNA interferase family)